MMRHVIIGNSIAAVHAIEALRAHDKTGSVTVIARENEHVYGPPLISYWLEEKISSQDLFYRPEDFYRKNDIRLLSGVTATGIDPQKKQVIVSSGEPVPFDRLLVACGGEPIIPSVPGLTPDIYFGYTRLSDVRDIKKVIRPGKQAVIVGGGLIGLKAAESLSRCGVKVIVLELANQILGSILPPIAAALVQSRMEQDGITFMLGNTITEVETESDGSRLITITSGGKLKTDLLIMAIGVRPALGLTKGTDLKTGRGILVNEFMETSIKNIYAAGDVAEERDLLTGEERVNAILPDAARQGAIAGANMAGGKERSQGGLSFNSLQLLDLSVMTIGRVLERSGEITQTEEIGGRWRRRILYWNGDCLTGAILINDHQGAGLLRDLILTQKSIPGGKERLRCGCEIIDLPSDFWNDYLGDKASNL